MKININDEFVMVDVPDRIFTVLTVSASKLRVRDNITGTTHNIQSTDFGAAVLSGLIKTIEKKKEEESNVEEQSSNFFSFDDM